MGMEFTRLCNCKNDVLRYFEELSSDWELIYYKRYGCRTLARLPIPRSYLPQSALALRGADPTDLPV